MSGPARQASKGVCRDAGQSAVSAYQRHHPLDVIAFCSTGSPFAVAQAPQRRDLGFKRRESGERSFNRFRRI
jgi:hypothetical protein